MSCSSLASRTASWAWSAAVSGVAGKRRSGFPRDPSGEGPPGLDDGRLPIAGGGGRRLRLVVEDGGQPPLDGAQVQPLPALIVQHLVAVHLPHLEVAGLRVREID